MLGDEVLLIQKDLGIQETLRIVRLGYDPYNPMTAEIELANFISGVEDQMYRIATTTVAKEKVYNGCRIGPDEGFVAERSDGKAKTIMNATEGISIYSDIGSGLAKNFFVGLDGRIQAKGLDIDGSGTFAGSIKANQLLIGGDNGTISFNDLTDKPLIPELPSYIKSTYIDSTRIESPTIIGGTVTGGIVIAGTNTKVKLYDAGGGFGTLEFLAADYRQAAIWYESTYSIFHIEAYGRQINIDADYLNFNGYPIATEQWVDNNYPTKWFVDDYYSPRTHNHGDAYVKSHTGQDLSLVATESGIVVRVNGVTLGSIFYD
jgi:hypothetical protein